MSSNNYKYIQLCNNNFSNPLEAKRGDYSDLGIYKQLLYCPEFTKTYETE